MKKTFIFILVAAAALGISAAPASGSSKQKVGLVNFKKVVEQSSLGKQEQEMYESMTKQFEAVLVQKEKQFNEISKKLRDDDFRDSQSPEALKKLEEEFQQIGMELQQGQMQYNQLRQQANMRIVQRIVEVISKASETVAKSKELDLILNNDNAFYSAPSLDVTEDVISEMDRITKEEAAPSSEEKEPAELDIKK